ncbi:hypothetical protein [Dyadobacter sp. LHD-138]|uniref:hypothetical protein n=1 Tax=Dyadobacter sp. LHD-138 TaxID=3071413 RepID=UPI0027E01110|nr:hypothetical protein [Dyadobacter sp. LHD-138]MDQ6481758.1 hypothetical protein [Dyadobacter sp. LHD-138]
MEKIYRHLLTLAQIREEFLLMEYYPKLLRVLEPIQTLSLKSELNMSILLLPPALFLMSKGIRRRVSDSPKLAEFLEPFLTTWMFTAMIFPSFFMGSRLLGLDSGIQSLASFFLLFFVIGGVIYQKKGLKPIFFDRKYAVYSRTNFTIVLDDRCL